MKFLKIFFAVVCAVVVLTAAAVWLFLKTFDINKYKPQIVTHMQKALGRDVSIDNLALNMSADRGIFLGIEGLKIADDPRFSKEDFLTVKEVSLGIDALAYLNKRQILISNIDVQSPRINIIRAQDGKINAQTIGFSQNQGLPAPDPAPQASGPEVLSSGEHKPFFPALLVKSVRIKDGFVRYRDQLITPEVSVEFSQAFLSVDGFSLTDPFRFSLEGSLWSKIKNIAAAGTGEINITESSLRLSDVKATSDLSDISIETLLKALPMLQPAGIKNGLEGKIQLAVDHVTVGAKGLMSLAAKGSLEEGRIELQSLPLPLSKINASFDATEDKIRIKDSSLNLGSGKITAKGNITDYVQSQQFDFVTEAQGIDLEEAIDQKGLSVKLTGKIDSQFDAQGRGLSRPESLKDSLSGSGTMRLNDGKLIGINVLRLVLDKMSMFPDLAEKIKGNLSEKYKARLEDKDTPLNKVDLNTFVKDGSLMIDDARIETDTFNLSGRGSMTFEQELNLEGDIAVPKELSQSMIAAEEGLGYIQDDGGEIMIPLSVQGKVPNLRFLPDLNYLGKKVFQSRGKEELQKVLDKAFGKDKEEAGSENPQNLPSENPPAQSQPSENGQEKSIEQQLIEGVLDKIFK